MRSHQTKSQHKRHLCSHCGKGFIYRSLLQEHMNIHTGIRPYQCDKCSASKWIYFHKNISHIQMNVGISTDFASRQNLRMHKRSHEPVKRHVCTECGRGFQKNNKLRIHMRIHTGEKVRLQSSSSQLIQNNKNRIHSLKIRGSRTNATFVPKHSIKRHR